MSELAKMEKASFTSASKIADVGPRCRLSISRDVENLEVFTQCYKSYAGVFTRVVEMHKDLWMPNKDFNDSSVRRRVYSA